MINPCTLVPQSWRELHPPVGTWIAILGVLGVIVPWLFRPPEKMGSREKAFWTLTLFVIFGLEIRTLYLDRDEHDREQAYVRCQELQNFNEIANTLSNAITSEAKHFDSTMSKLEDTLNTETGGEDFAYAEVYQQQNYRSLVVSLVGKYPLSELNIRVADIQRLNALLADKNIPRDQLGSLLTSGDISFKITDKFVPGHVFFFRMPLVPIVNNEVSLNIFFESTNGDWTEEYRAKRLNNKWTAAIRVTRQQHPGQKLRYWEKVDKDYPKNAEGKVQWN